MPRDPQDPLCTPCYLPGTKELPPRAPGGLQITPTPPQGSGAFPILFLGSSQWGCTRAPPTHSGFWGAPPQGMLGTPLRARWTPSSSSSLPPSSSGCSASDPGGATWGGGGLQDPTEPPSTRSDAAGALGPPRGVLLPPSPPQTVIKAAPPPHTPSLFWGIRRVSGAQNEAQMGGVSPNRHPGRLGSPIPPPQTSIRFYFSHLLLIRVENGPGGVWPERGPCPFQGE